MMIQYIFLTIIVAAAAWYIGSRLIKPFRKKVSNSCEGACTKCEALDQLKEI